MLDKLPCRYSKTFSGRDIEGKGFSAVGYTATIENFQVPFIWKDGLPVFCQKLYPLCPFN